MTTQDDLYNTLWDYVYGLLEPDEALALEARITSEHDVARAYAEVRQQADHLQAAARLDIPPVPLKLPDERQHVCPAPQVTTEPLPLRAARWVLAAAALVLVMLSLAVWRESAQLRNSDVLTREEQKLAAAQTRLVAIAPAVIDAEIQQRISVQAVNLLDQPQDGVKLAYKLADVDGIQLAGDNLVTNDHGCADVVLSSEQVSRAKQLELWCEEDSQAVPLQVPLTAAAPRFQTSIVTDKSTYRPGESVYFRSLTLRDLPINYARDFQVRYGMLSADGTTQLATPVSGLTDLGVGSGALRLAENAQAGRFGIVVDSQDAEFPPAAAWFDIAGNTSQMWNKQLLFGKRIYAPGEEVEVKLKAITERGEPAANVQLDLVGTFNGTRIPIDPANGETNRLGEYTAKFNLPATPAVGQAEIKATLSAGGAMESIEQVIQVQDDTVALVRNQPAQAPPEKSYRLLARQSLVDAYAPVPLHVSRGTVSGAAKEQLLVAAMCCDKEVGQRFVEFDDEQTSVDFDLPIAPQAAGPIRVSLYDSDFTSPESIADCWVRRPPANYWKVVANPAQQEDKNTNGEQIWDLQTVDESNTPRSAVLGVCVVADDLANNRAPARPELLVENGVAQKTATLSDSLDDLASYSYTASSPQTPLLARYDNYADVEVAYRSATANWAADRQATLRQYAQMIAGGSVVLLLALIMLVTLRLAGRETYWLPMLTTGAATLLVSISWIGAQVSLPESLLASRFARAVSQPIGESEQLRQMFDQPTQQPQLGTPLNRGLSALHSGVFSEDTLAGRQYLGRNAQSEYFGESLQEGNHYYFAPQDWSLQTHDHLLLFSRYTNGRIAPLPGETSASAGLSFFIKPQVSRLDDHGTEPLHQPENIQEFLPELESKTLQDMKSVSPRNNFNFLLPPRLPVTTFTATNLAASPDTLYWNPLLVTDDQGRAQIRLPQPPTTRKYRLRIDAHGSGRAGELDQVINP